MVSYIKTQWFRLLVGFVSLGLMCYYLFQPGADESTLEGLSQNLDNAFAALCFFITAMIWFLSSIIEYHKDCIELLEKKSEKYDALCELVDELRNATRVHNEIEKIQDQRIKKLEDKLR